MKFPLDDVAKQVLEKRYIHEGESSWEDVVERVLNHVVPKSKETYRELLLERYFVPNSPTLVNAGTKIGGLSACYVVPLYDSIEQIAATKFYFMKIVQKGGGVGTTLSHIRPEGTPVAGSTHSKAAGPIKFFNTICEDMKAMTQSGFREAAMMGTMSVKHPDIEKFIRAKEQEGVMHTANLSVMVSDRFMEAVRNEELWLTRFLLPQGPEFVRQFGARYLFDLIAEHAWANGEPGVLFEDTIYQNSPYRYSYPYLDATNPCGEQPLPPFGTCNLGSIDISKYYRKDHGEYEVDLELLEQHIRLAVLFLNFVIDESDWPLPEIAEWVNDNRPIGLGVMGFADLLLKQGVAYGSTQSVQEAKFLSGFFRKVAEETSQELGEKYGYPKNCQVLPRPRRNITTLSIAPTGSLALIAGCSHGIEPVYAGYQIRRDNTGEYKLSHPYAGAPFFRSAVGAKPVSWKEHIDIQSAWQLFIDSAVSKTINMPSTATVDDVKSAILYAWRSGCKGITIYRDGSRKVQVLSKDEPKLVEPVTWDRPRQLNSITVKMAGAEENVYVTISHDNGQPMEVFVNTASTLLHDVQMRDGFSRLSSLALRFGVPVERLVKELRQIPAQSLKSIPLLIAKVLEELFMQPPCPECGSPLEMAEGCYYCGECGYNKCS